MTIYAKFVRPRGDNFEVDLPSGAEVVAVQPLPSTRRGPAVYVWYVIREML